jgi:hypothetical protein
MRFGCLGSAEQSINYFSDGKGQEMGIDPAERADWRRT